MRKWKKLLGYPVKFIAYNGDYSRCVVEQDGERHGLPYDSVSWFNNKLGSYGSLKSYTSNFKNIINNSYYDVKDFIKMTWWNFTYPKQFIRNNQVIDVPRKRWKDIHLHSGKCLF